VSEVQALTLIASILGLVATVLNLVAFVREKDKGHTRAGLFILTLLALAMALFFLPHYAPELARSWVGAMPPRVASFLEPWVASPAVEQPAVPTPTAPPEVATPSATPTPEAPPLQGSFSIEIHRNLLGGIGALVANFNFANLSPEPARVVAYHIRIVEKKGQEPHNYDRVLAKTIDVAASATIQSEVELDPEIRDRWVPWHDVEAAQRGAIEIRWEAQDSKGKRFSFSASNG
jgi:hypothetical protein